MAFLRFSRDKRGYESTFLLQNVREHGKIRSRVLYWFRTPPNVKVGRAVLDEDAIRLIEEANPDIDIDWAKVLKAKPLPAPEEDARSRRRSRPRSAEAPAAIGRKRRSPSRREKAPPVVESETSPDDFPDEVPDDLAEAVSIVDDHLVESGAGDQDEPRPVAGPGADGRAHPVEALIGAEGHARLQAQYAELLARITVRVKDADKRTQLRVEAAVLDPDGWVTAEDAKAGVESFEARIHEFRSKLGRRARRSRRGGRGRRGRGSRPVSPDAPGEPQASAPGATVGSDGED